MSLPTVIVGSVLSDAASETQPDSRPAVSMVKSARAHLTRLCLFIPMPVSSLLLVVCAADWHNSFLIIHAAALLHNRKF